MPRGLSKIKQVAAENAAKKKAYDEGGSGIRFLTLQDGETAKVRFLEQGEEVWYLWCHQLPKQPGQRFGDWVQCLDQDDAGTACPGCERGKTRSARVVISVIWFGAPKFERDKDNKLVKDGNDRPKVIGSEDTLAVWHRGTVDGGRLEYLDSQYNGLTGHIFKVHRQGATKDDTTYHIDVDERDTLPSAAERELFEKKPDPRKAIKTMTYGDMARAYSGGGNHTTPGSVGQGDPDESPGTLADNAFAKAAAGGAVSKGAFGL